MAVGIFATFDQVLLTAGPVGIWLWLIAAVGQTLVALVVAQFAARIPLSGSSYQWASRLGNPRVGWWFGWLTFSDLPRHAGLRPSGVGLRAHVRVRVRVRVRTAVRARGRDTPGP
ncbi:amino acid permease [Streptomyces sp. H27-G5]|uniref:amino acid permease n=1 Tax=Streptomyces sp. H27-G5 TaxID=2996698 RepID=UPI003B637CB7